MSNVVDTDAFPSLLYLVLAAAGGFLAGVVVGALVAVAVLLRALTNRETTPPLGKKEHAVEAPKRATAWWLTIPLGIKSQILRLARWWDDWSRRYGSTLQVLCMVAVTVCAIGLYANNRNDRAQDQRRADDRDSFIRCFDKTITALLGSLPPVREATGRRDLARAAYDRAQLEYQIGDDGIGGIILRAQQGQKRDPAKDLATLAASVEKVRSAAANLAAAEAELVAVRKANPYPPLPSEFCNLP